MAEREKKLRKLQDLRAQTPYVSKSALEGILSWVKQNGELPLASSKHMREANRATLAGANAYGPVLVEKEVLMVDGSKMSLPFLNLHSFLHAGYSAGGALFELLKDVAGPAGLAQYSDEVCPGNALAASTPRKCWVVYAGIVQSHRHLQNEKAWITLCCLRTSIVQKVEAGMSQVFKIILKMIFESDEAGVLDMGLLLQGPAGCAAGYERKRLRMKLAFMVQDGAAHKQCWSLKGDAGSRFCGLCKNVFSHMEDEEGISDAGRWLSFSQLDLATSQEVFESWDRMATRALTCTAADFKCWQQATGITYSPEALLADHTLREVLDPCEQYKHDWMHALMSNGVLSLGVFNLLEGMGAWSNFGEYVAQWTIPAHRQHAGINVKNLFADKRVQKHRNSCKFNCTASELLTVLPILSHYASRVCRDYMKNEGQCICKLAWLVELLQSTWFMDVSASDIETSSEEALAVECCWLENDQETPLALAPG
jgi:hypothetical protein